MHNWDENIERRGTDNIKWDGVEAFVGKAGLLPFWVADMDFYSPEVVVESLTNRAKHGVFGYTMDSESAEMAFANWVLKRQGLTVQKNWVVKSPGVVTAIGLAIQSFTTVGDGIVIQPPVYPPFAEMTLINERRLIKNPLKMIENQAEMDLEHLEMLFKTEKPKMMILCNPHNPVGRVWEREVIEKVVKLCEIYEVLLFSDEIHCDLLFKDAAFTSALSVSEKESPWVISAMAPSKTFNIAGLYYSLILIPNRERRKQFRNVMNRLHMNAVNCFNELAAYKAYDGGEEWLQNLMPYLEENYKTLCEFVKEKMPGVSVAKMQGTYLAWLDFRAWFEDGDQLKDFMIKGANIAVNDGRTFGEEGQGFVRFNFGCPKNQMLAGLEQIVEAKRERDLV